MARGGRSGENWRQPLRHDGAMDDGFFVRPHSYRILVMVASTRVRWVWRWAGVERSML